MTIRFETWPEARAIVIRASGDVDAAAVDAMRGRTVELTNETGFRNYLVDMSELRSIADNDTFAAYDLGDRFGKVGIAFSTRTAVIMPTDAEARRQAEFLHTVELNRGRGDLSYVNNADEAYDWFHRPVPDQND
jgi:hypothetical protein